MGDIVGLAAVVMLFAIPLVGIGSYTYYRVNKLRTEERLAAIARGVEQGIQFVGVARADEAAVAQRRWWLIHQRPLDQRV